MVVDFPDFQKITRHVFTELTNRLAPKYTYHSLGHTTMVLRDATFLANKMGISDSDMRLLKTAISLHDFGFVSSHENHEERGCEEARKVLPAFNYTPEEIDRICGMIMATKIPQSPTNLLEQIICDADLYYLGTPYYFQVADLFEQELTALGVLKNKEQWTNIQVTFLENHRYHTEFARELLEETKQKNLAFIKCCN